MILSYASNAVLSKARALYGKRIKEKNYIDLMGCSSVSEIASYLKYKTEYAYVLKDINENDIHRGYLETLLRRKLFLDFALLGRYDLSVGQHFLGYFVTRAEIEQIMYSLMLLSAGRTGEYIYSIPIFFESHTKIDLPALSGIKNYDDFLDIIKRSPYYSILLPFKPAKGNLIDLTGIETELYTYLYKLVFEMINKYVWGKPRKQLIELFTSYIDLSNLIRIIRMKKFYNLSSEYIMSCLLPFGKISANQLKSFVYSDNNSQMMLDMKETTIGRKWFSKGLDIVDKIPRYMRFVKSKHNIRFSTSPPVVMLSYIFLQEVELINIINIIEGIRYKLSIKEISKMIIK